MDFNIEHLQMILDAVQGVADGAVIVAALWLLVQALPAILTPLSFVLVVWICIRGGIRYADNIRQTRQLEASQRDFEARVREGVERRIDEWNTCAEDWRLACEQYVKTHKRSLFIPRHKFEQSHFNNFINVVYEIEDKRRKELSPP